MRSRSFTPPSSLGSSLALLVACCAGTAWADRPPLVAAPVNATVREGALLCFDVNSTDPDGDPITFCTVSGNPPGSTLMPNPGGGFTFCWTPSFDSAGSYTVTFTCCNALCGSATTVITVLDVINRPPVLNPIANMTVNEGATAGQAISGSDPDGAPLTFSKASGPLFMTVTTTSATTGTINVAPGFADSGTYGASVTATNGVLGDTKLFTITVIEVCQPLVADPGGPYQGFAAAPIQFDGTGSFDPNGGPLTYAWDFGDGTSGVGPTPSHAYPVLGSFTVTLTVSGSCGTSTATTTAEIVAACGADAFVRGANRTIRLGSGKPVACLQIQPESGCYANPDVDLGSIVMRYSGGAVTEIHAVTGKSTPSSDTNGDGIEEITACFTKEDLRLLFSALPSGENFPTVTLHADLVGGGQVETTVPLRVLVTGGSLAATIRPNPLNPDATLSFETKRPGFVRATLFDHEGRRIRVLFESAQAPPGHHEVRFRAMGERGTALGSGVYFYRIETPEDVATGRCVIAK